MLHRRKHHALQHSSIQIERNPSQHTLFTHKMRRINAPLNSHELNNQIHAQAV